MYVLTTLKPLLGSCHEGLQRACGGLVFQVPAIPLLELCMCKRREVLHLLFQCFKIVGPSQLAVCGSFEVIHFDFKTESKKT